LADPQIKEYFDQLEDGQKNGFMSSVNLSEFYYKTCQALGREVAQLRYYQSRRTSLVIIETDEELSKLAGVEKCRHRMKLSLADCYALALARQFKSTILTTDRELASVDGVSTLLFKV
jgi:predicted nucleic acid-binding protein